MRLDRIPQGGHLRDRRRAAGYPHRQLPGPVLARTGRAAPQGARAHAPQAQDAPCRDHRLLDRHSRDRARGTRHHRARDRASRAACRTLSLGGFAIGVGVGMGLQKLAANYVSGFVILAERSLRIGDLVRVDNLVLIPLRI